MNDHFFKQTKLVDDKKQGKNKHETKKGTIETIETIETRKTKIKGETPQVNNQGCPSYLLGV